MALRTPLSVTPHLYMGDSTGRPLDMGTVYFGEQDKDPEFYPIELFSDDELTKPLMQPVHTKGGYLYDKGDMVEPHAKEIIYSVKVLDSYGRKVFYKGAMMRNSWNDDVIEQINTAIIGSADVARQVATDITNDAINNTAVEGGVLADTFVTATANGAGTVARNQRDKNSDIKSILDFDSVESAEAYALANNIKIFIPSGEHDVEKSGEVDASLFWGQGTLKNTLNADQKTFAWGYGFITPEMFGGDMQSAVNYAILMKRRLLLSDKTYTLNQSLMCYPRHAAKTDDTLHIVGAGSNLTKLVFTSGSLIIASPNFHLSGMSVQSLDSDGIVLKSEARDNAVITYPTRGFMQDVRGERSEKSGIRINNTWIITAVDCYFRYNKHWGLNLDHTKYLPDGYNLACNNFNMLGGEIQGNGGTLGGGFAGQWGGIHLGRSIGVNFTGVAIEGNYGDGVVFEGASNNVVFDTCYVEKNGVTPENLDFRHDAVTSPTDRPINVRIKNCNHTPNSYGQVRSYGLYDIVNLKVIDPIFFGSPAYAFVEAPIQISESVAKYSSGYIQGGTLNYSGYTKMLDNQCVAFGKKTTVFLSSQQKMATGADITETFMIPFVTEEDGKELSINAVANFSSKTAGGNAYIRLGFGGLPNTTLHSSQHFELASEGENVRKIQHSNIRIDRYVDGATILLSRIGSDAKDTYGGTVTFSGALVTYNKGWVD